MLTALEMLAGGVFLVLMALALAPVTGEPYLEFSTTGEDDGGGRQ